jgi:hypothetical protein
MRKFGWLILVIAMLMAVPGTIAAGGRVVLLEQTMNVGCG